MVIRFYASIRQITGEREVEWGEPALTLGELLRLLSDRYGPEFRRWVLDGEELGGDVLVLINGTDARHQAGLATCLAATDAISILPIMAGGGEIGHVNIDDTLTDPSLFRRLRVPPIAGRFPGSASHAAPARH